MGAVDVASCTGFVDALIVDKRSPDIPESEDVYGWLIGSWEFTVAHYPDPSAAGAKGEIHFARTLEGRAVQDVWIMPRRADRPSKLNEKVTLYGTTLRIWDAASKAWRVTWINGTTGTRDELVGRWSGKDIVQIGTHSDGRTIRWIFNEISKDSFRWVGEVLNPDGATWTLEAEFRAKRV